MTTQHFSISGRFIDWRTGLTGVFALALVLGKLNPETLLRVRNPLEGGHRNLELTIAKSAESESRNRAQPFEHTKISLLHEQQFATVRILM
jgi:hypothetical protein